MNNSAPHRILRIVAVMNRGGIESQIMNLYRKIDRTQFQYDFLVTRNEKGIFDDEIERMGGRIYRIAGIREVGFNKFIKSIDEFFKNHNEYKIVHSHMNTWSGLFLNIAKKNSIPVRIAHSHSAQQGVKISGVRGKCENLIKGIMKRFIHRGATHFWAVGEAAGEWLFGKKIKNREVKILPNAKDLSVFKYNEQKRIKYRKELNIPLNALVVGHVGSFSTVKNHQFILDLFPMIINSVTESYLCLVGDGTLRFEMEEKVKSSEYKDNVFFLGIRNNVNELMSVFDVLILPSFFEGMPNVVIEAQASRLPCVVSDTITKEIDMNLGLVKFVSLTDNKDIWVKHIISARHSRRDGSVDNMISKGYDLNEQIKWIENFYTECIDK